MELRLNLGPTQWHSGLAQPPTSRVFDRDLGTASFVGLKKQSGQEEGSPSFQWLLFDDCVSWAIPKR